MTAPVAVVLMSYGSPRSIEEIEPYYTDIRRGRPPTPEALADLRARYEAIGGVDALAITTAQQRTAIQAALDELDPGSYDVQLGFKHADPKVEEFFFGHMDPYRFIVNLDYARPLTPPKQSFRSEPNDFQVGEIEIDGRNLFYDEWNWTFELHTVPLGVAGAKPASGTQTR